MSITTTPQYCHHPPRPPHLKRCHHAKLRASLNSVICSNILGLFAIPEHSTITTGSVYAQDHTPSASSSSDRSHKNEKDDNESNDANDENVLDTDADGMATDTTNTGTETTGTREGFSLSLPPLPPLPPASSPRPLTTPTLTHQRLSFGYKLLASGEVEFSLCLKQEPQPQDPASTSDPHLFTLDSPHRGPADHNTFCKNPFRSIDLNPLVFSMSEVQETSEHIRTDFQTITELYLEPQVEQMKHYRHLLSLHENIHTDFTPGVYAPYFVASATAFTAIGILIRGIFHGKFEITNIATILLSHFFASAYNEGHRLAEIQRLRTEIDAYDRTFTHFNHLNLLQSSLEQIANTTPMILKNHRHTAELIDFVHHLAGYLLHHSIISQDRLHYICFPAPLQASLNLDFPCTSSSNLATEESAKVLIDVLTDN